MTAPHGTAFLLLGAGLGALLLQRLLPLLRRRLVDQPNARSSHRRPTPRGGGLAFVLVGGGLAPLAGEGWGAAHSRSAAMSASIWASLCAAESEIRSRAVPAGTVGGRMAGTHRPCVNKRSASATATPSTS